MKKILVTGFEPFNGRTVNPSAFIVEKLTPPENTILIKKILPVEFAKSGRILKELTDREHPDCILSIGQAGNVPNLSVEKVAINLDSCLSRTGGSTLADGAQVTLIDTPILPGGPTAYFSRFPVRDLVETLKQNEIPASVSFSAGTYVCNHVMYIGCHLAEQTENMISGFVHVPFLPEQLEGQSNTDGQYSMPFEIMLKGVQLLLNELQK